MVVVADEECEERGGGRVGEEEGEEFVEFYHFGEVGGVGEEVVGEGFEGFGFEFVGFVEGEGGVVGASRWGGGEGLGGEVFVAKGD